MENENDQAVATARVQDVLAEARNCVECLCLAAEGLDEKADPIQYVADIASKRINEAIAMLETAKGEEKAAPRVFEDAIRS
jgi:hypothetical protein